MCERMVLPYIPRINLTQHAKLLHVTVHNLLQAATAHENSRPHADRRDLTQTRRFICFTH